VSVVIRADASLQIGTGHIMRCLTLAQALKENKAQVEFICRAHEGNLIGYIQQKGFKVHSLPILEPKTAVLGLARLEGEKVLAHSDWLGATQLQDADECKVILKKLNPDWLIVDHYAIDEIWQKELQGAHQKLMVIDDLADRRHECDLLLDQTFGRQLQDYQKLVPDNCQMLLGSQYALLRPEFAQWREYSLKRRKAPEFKTLLITMGGVDQNNVTGQVLEELRNCELPLDMEITVIMGGTAPHIEDVKSIAEKSPYKAKIMSNIANMAEIMANSDIAIGASGATTWERCCLGLPSIQVELADNQKVIFELVRQSGIALCIQERQLQQLCSQIKRLESRQLEIVENSAMVADGMGVFEVKKYLQ
jgi:UDP-2,4-diacetamido-2,4,6-trideoxy-beta-L-altropyranose hydrolase